MAKSLQRQIIEQARDLISDKERWVQGALAENGECVNVNPADFDAVKFCAIGAVRHVGAKMGMADTTSVERVLAHVVANPQDDNDMSNWTSADCEGVVASENDDEGDGVDAHADILALFDLALEEVV